MIARQETFNSKNEVWSALAAPVPSGTISWRQDGKPVEDPATAYARSYGSASEKLVPRAAVSAVSFDTTEPNMLSDGDAVSCSKCGGRMWDNRLTKRNPKAPNYKCCDRNCDGVVWPARSDEGHSEAAEVATNPERAVVAAESVAAVPARKSRAAKVVLTDAIPF